MMSINSKILKSDAASLNEIVEKKLTPEARQALEAMQRVRRQKGFFATTRLPTLRYVSCDQNDD